MTSANDWWRSAVTYQVYLRSFRDGDGDGVGDIAGIRERLPYLAGLGVDALWINPWYPSPMADAGYDVADYRGIEPLFGTLDEAGALIDEAHELGLRVVLDIVPNHTSDQHAWFRAALAAAPGSPERGRYLFRDGRGADGSEPPNDWQSVFGGPGWSRVTEADGTPGQWYLHLFAPQQPDLDWTSRDVRDEFLDVLRFWFERGVDGFRIDVAHGLAKHPDLPDLGDQHGHLLEGSTAAPGSHPHWDRDEVHEIYREWRAVADEFSPPRAFVAEAWVDSPERMVRYLRPDELHTAFNFDYLTAPWRPEWLRRVIDATLASASEAGAPATWVLENHDVARVTSRFAREQHDRPGWGLRHFADQPLDLEVGTRRARAAALLMLALPGGAYVYQGQELGLPEVEDIPDELLDDPVFVSSAGADRGRDGCRVPIPWSHAAPGAGFAIEPDTARAPWMWQPDGWAAYAEDAQEGEPTSMLELYRAALHARRDLAALQGDAGLAWLEAPSDVLAFTRGDDFACVVNVAAEPAALPPGFEPVLASAPLTAEDRLPSDAAVWLVRSGSRAQ